MLKVIVIMFVGIVFGAVFRYRTKLITILKGSVIWVIFALLFAMGISIGNNAEIMSHISTIGIRGLQLSLAATTGSVLMAWVLFKLFFMRDKHLKK